jgi:hypothetical protein
VSGNRLTFAATLQDQVSRGLDLINTRFKQTSTQASLLGNVGAMAVAKGFGIVDQALSSVIGVMGEAVKGAMADEESQNRLAASLKANVAGWDGNTAAIEKSILASQRLGFDDETLRDSLTVLVGATHNVAKAQQIQATAMDLARFKGIDLRTASEALIKVEGGHYRSLVQLGIKLKDGATQTEALAAVQAVAAGQAEAYADTTSGKVAAAQVKWNEALEQAGYTLLPLVTEGLSDLSRGLDPLSVSLEDTAKAAAGGSQSAAGRLQALQEQQDATAASAVEAAKHINQAETRYLQTEPIDAMGQAALDAGADTKTGMDSIVLSFANTRSSLESIADGFGESVYGPLIAKEELLALQAEDRALRQKRAAKETTVEEKKQIDLQLNQDYQKQVGMLAHLAAIGDADATMQLTRLANEILADKNSSAENKTWAKGVLHQLGLVKQGYKDIYHSAQQSMSVNPFQWINKFGGGANAEGTKFWEGGLTLVGEKGPEIVNLPRGSAIYSNADSKAMMRGGGTVSMPWSGGGGKKTLVVPLIVNGREIARATIPDFDEEDYWQGQLAGGSTVEN